MTRDQLAIAIEWLLANDGEDGEAQACTAVAGWLKAELKRREHAALVRETCKKYRLPAYRVRTALLPLLKGD